jgi:DNA-binding IclR family transcriptional regulator
VPQGDPDAIRPGGVQSLVRAFALLEAMSAAPSEVGIAELAKQVALHVSTVHRLLATLVRLGYVRQSPQTGRYGLGAKTFHLAHAYLGHLDLRRAVRPVLLELSQATGETANLVILDEGEALYLDKVESPRSLQIFSRIGRRAPLHCTAAGKVLLAFREREAKAVLTRERFEPLTRRTITSREQLLRELEKVREQGFGLDLEECEAGARCIAAPVHGPIEEAVAAISVSGPVVRMPMKRVQAVTADVVAAARRVSEQIGWQAEPFGTGRASLGKGGAEDRFAAGRR